MRDKEIKEGLADLAQRAEMDHEVQMARSILTRLLSMLSNYTKC